MIILPPYLRAGTISGGGGGGGDPGPTYFAATTADGGSASNDGTELSPWTIEHALTELFPGDTLRVKGSGPWGHDTGTWQGGALNPSRSGTAEAPIIIRSHVARQFTIEKTAYIGGTEHRPAIGIVERSYIHVKDFTVDGTAKWRGSTTDEDLYQGVLFEGLDVIGGDREGADDSLFWGICFFCAANGTVRNCRVSSLVNTGNSGDNTTGIEMFTASDHIVENNYVDATNVHSAYGMKGGDTNRVTYRYNIAANCRSGNGGSNGAGFYFKADTAANKFCDDNEAYQNIVWNAYRAFQLNHNCRRSLISNNTARNVDRFFRQWQNNNIDAEIWNNICRGNGSTTRAYEFEDASSTPDLSVYLAKANHNCMYNTNSAHATWSGGSLSLANFRTSDQTASMVGRDVDTITGDPLFVTDADAGDFHLQGGSPCIGTGEGGANMGAYITGSELIGPDWI